MTDISDHVQSLIGTSIPKLRNKAQNDGALLFISVLDVGVSIRVHRCCNHDDWIRVGEKKSQEDVLWMGWVRKRVGN